MTDEDWSAATFEGAVAASRRNVATASARQRLDWLEDALALALASGALTRHREAKQRAIATLWG